MHRLWIKVLVATMLASLIVWVSVCVDVLVHPDVDPQGPVEAVYVIGPVGERMDEVVTLMDSGVAPVLFATISVDAETSIAYPAEECGVETATYRVECVVPDPYTTRGEARFLGEQVAQHGWSRVAVVTSTPHAARTRLLMDRCTDAEVLLWTVDGERGMGEWAKEFAYQSAAWVKTQVARGC